MYLDAYLQPCPGYGWEGGPEFKTQIIELMNGRERRNAEWSQAKHRYTAPFNNINKLAYREIKRMHLACRGMLHCFRFRDQLDYEAVNEVFGEGDGTKTQFQLIKTSVVDTIAYVRAVHAVDGDITVTINGVATTAYTINDRTGVVTFTSPVPDSAIVRWSGIFDVWVRFAEDYLPFTLDNPNATNGSVNLIEVPPPIE